MNNANICVKYRRQKYNKWVRLWDEWKPIELWDSPWKYWKGNMQMGGTFWSGLKSNITLWSPLMNKIFHSPVAILSVFLSFFLFSCEKKKTSVRDYLRINLNCDPMTVDPRKTADPTSCMITFMLFEGLTHLEPDGNITLACAESVELSKDRKSYWGC